VQGAGCAVRFNKPSKLNEAAFPAAVDAVAAGSRELLGALETNAPPKDQDAVAARARARAARRYGRGRPYALPARNTQVTIGGRAGRIDRPARLSGHLAPRAVGAQKVVFSRIETIAQVSMGGLRRRM
jgi:hypothetical protein